MTKLIRITKHSGLVSANVDGKQSIENYSRIIREISARCGADVASLFARPETPDKPDPANPEVTWFTELDGNVIELQATDNQAQRPILEKLRNHLKKLQPLLDDPTLGPVVASSLYIPSSHDLISVGGAPVLINWGYLTQAVASSSTLRETHFADTLGKYAPATMIKPPPFAAGEGETYAARMQQRSGRGSSLPSAVPAGPVTVAGAPGAETFSAAETKISKAPIIACAIALAVLLFLLIPGVLISFNDSAARADLELQKKIRLDEIETKKEKLRRLQNEPKVCTAPGGLLVPIAPLPGAPVPPPGARTDLTPPPVDRISVPPPPGGPDTSSVPLNQLLDESVVMVFGRSQKGTAHGTGFYINDTQLVTNRHVVEDLDPDKIWVINKISKNAISARVVAQTEPSVHVKGPLGSKQDLAVLEVTGAPAHKFLSIAASPRKGTDVESVGYPGFIVEIETAMSEIRGALSRISASQPFVDPRVAPDSNIERGYITSKQEDLPFPLLVHSARIARGNSGGPLVDLCGRVVGVNTWGVNEKDSYTLAFFAQDASQLKLFLASKSIAAQYDEVERTCPLAVIASGATPPTGATAPGSPSVPATATPIAPASKGSSK